MTAYSAQIRSKRSWPIAGLTVALLLSVSIEICAQTPSFNGAVDYSVGAAPITLVSADLNGDGIPDLVTANIRGNTVSVMLGNGDGTFKPEVEYPVGSAPVQIVIADVNGDGVPDLAVVNSGSYNISILLGKGDGTFKPALNASVAPHPPAGVAIGDFNGDGIADLAVVSSNQSVSILFGHGDGNFDENVDFNVSISMPLGITQIIAARINTDDYLDLVTLNSTNSSISVLLGNGDGTFQAAQYFPVFGDLPKYMVAADFNHDGITDIAVGSLSGGISILIGNGDGTFNNPAFYPAAGSIGALAAANISGNVIPDLVIANSDNFADLGYVTVFLNNGDGTFSAAPPYPTMYSPTGVAVADFDRNGHPDLAVAVSASSSVLVYLSNAITPQTGYWWNPAESGRGYVIEKQGDNVFMAAFLYDATGRSTWYGVGPVAMIGPSFNTKLNTYADGQTLTGAWQPATQAASPGNVSIAFSDATHATLTWPGGAVPIQRFAFVPNGLTLPHQPLDPQPGWWWNPKQPGRGFAVEVQGGNAYIAGYMYDGSGNPVWYVSGPTALVSDSYQGGWTTFTGGQTLLGTYQPPTVTGNAGSLTIQFTSQTTGTLTLPNGTQIPIQRFSF